MSYEPLHHKYRPQTFTDLVGQEAIATTLTNAIVSQRIAPAYLFTGPRGTGKTSSARILAKSLNCVQNSVPTAHPCGNCQVCKSIASGYAVDVVEIDAASNTGVDNIREVIERAQFAPVQCRYKVYVIDECHMLSTAAFNALLKTLEEPPSRVVFVLATTDQQRVLPTIISRCQRFDFRRIPLDPMVKHLSKIASQENINIAPDAVTLVAQVAQGGLRDAESLLDQLSLLPGEVTVEKVWDLVGAVPERDLMALTKAIDLNDSETVLDQCRRLMDRGREPLVVLQNLAGFYRDLLIAHTAPKRSDLVAVTPPTWTQLCEFAKGLNVSSILQSQQHLKNSEAQIKNTTQPRLWLEVTILGLLPSANTPALVETSLTSPRTSGQRSETVQPFRQENHEIPASNVSPGSQALRSLESATQPTIPVTSTSTNGGSPTPITPSDQPSTASSTSIQPPTEEPKDNSTTTVSTYSDIPSPPPVEPSTDAQNDVDQIWQQVLAYLPLPSKALFSQHGYLVAFNGQQAQIGIRAPKLIKMAQPRLLDIELAFQKARDQKVKVILAVNQPSAAQFKPDEGLPVENSVPKASLSTNTLLAPTTIAPEDVANNDSSTTSPIQVASSRSPQATLKPEVSHLIAPQSPLPAQDVTPKLELPSLLVSDWDVDEVDKVLGNVKQFFDGEIIDLADDFPLRDIVLAHPSALEEADLEEDDSLSEVTATSEAAAMPLGKQLQIAPDSTGTMAGPSHKPDALEPATAHPSPSSKISAPNHLDVSAPGDGEDDDDIPF